MSEPKEEIVSVTQVRRVTRPSLWLSRTLGEIVLPSPGPGPEKGMVDRLRKAFVEGERAAQKIRWGNR